MLCGFKSVRTTESGIETTNWASGIPQGVTSAGFAVDMHVKILDQRVVDRAKARGLDALVYAPHFTRLPQIRRQAERYADDDLAIIPARELFTGTWQRRRHVLAIGLSEPVPDFLTLDATITELRRQDAAILVPHPGFLSVSLGRNDISIFADAIDAVEVYNPKHLPHHNRRARKIASESGLPTFTSSYAHLHRTVGEARVEFESAVPTAEELGAALREGAARRVVREQGLGHGLRCALEFAHLGYENTWSKFDRIVLQGTTATHPDHVAYGGAFDDVKVY